MTGPWREALAGILDDMRRVSADLEQALAAERDALDAGDTTALDTAATRKQTLLLDIERLDAERVQLLGAGPQPAATNDAVWPGIVATLRRCHALNQENGKLVVQRLQFVRRALNVLSGAGEGEGLYDRSGELHTGSRSRSLAAA